MSFKDLNCGGCTSYGAFTLHENERENYMGSTNNNYGFQSDIQKCSHCSETLSYWLLFLSLLVSVSFSLSVTTPLQFNGCVHNGVTTNIEIEKQKEPMASVKGSCCSVNTSACYYKSHSYSSHYRYRPRFRSM